jgi:hypothetical protein
LVDKSRKKGANWLTNSKFKSSFWLTEQFKKTRKGTYGNAALGLSL